MNKHINTITKLQQELTKCTEEQDNARLAAVENGDRRRTWKRGIRMKIDTIGDMRRRIEELEGERDEMVRIAGFERDDGDPVETVRDLRRSWAATTIDLGDAIDALDTARADLAKAMGREGAVRSMLVVLHDEADNWHSIAKGHRAGSPEKSDSFTRAHYLRQSAEMVARALGLPASPAPPEPEPDGGRTCGDDVTADDTRFMWPFGTVRACVDCGVLVSGGPTRCLRCAGIATKQRQQEPKGHGFAGVCRACGEVMQYDGSCPTCDDMERQDGGGDE